MATRTLTINAELVRSPEPIWNVSILVLRGKRRFWVVGQDADHAAALQKALDLIPAETPPA